MSVYEKLVSQKGEVHIFSNGFLYRPDKSGYRCNHCNKARGRIGTNNKFVLVGKHNHEVDENKIIKKLISSKFTEIAIKYSLSFKDLTNTYGKFKNKYTKYSHLICSRNAILQRARRNLEKFQVSKSKGKSKKYSESKEKKIFEELDALVYDIENKYMKAIKNNNSSATDLYVATSVTTQSPVEYETQVNQHQENREFNYLLAELEATFVDNQVDVNRLENSQPNYDAQTKPFNLVIRNTQQNLIPFDIPIHQDSGNNIIDLSELIRFTDRLKANHNNLTPQRNDIIHNCFLKRPLNIDCSNSAICSSVDDIPNNFLSNDFIQNNFTGKENHLKQSVNINEEQQLNELLENTDKINSLFDGHSAFDFAHSLSQLHDDETIVSIDIPEDV